MIDLDRPPKWGIVAIVFLVMSNILLLVLLLQRSSDAPDPQTSSPGPVAGATSSAPTTTAPRTTTPPSAADPGVLAVYGDGYSSGNSEGGIGDAGWPALVAAQLGMQLQLQAATLAGYVAEGSTGQTFPQLVQAAPVADASVTVVFGSRNDAEAAAQAVRDAAADTFAEIRAADASTQLLVIGPSWSDADPPASLTSVSAAVQSAAEEAGATYVDPLGLGWFADPDGLVSPVDGISVLDAGHRYLAGLIAPLVEAERTR